MAVAWYAYNMLRPFLWSWTNLIGHSGYDLAAPCGTPITAPVDGTIITSGPYPWGGQIDLIPDNTDQIPGYTDNIVLTWIHLSREDVGLGHVTAGQQLGLSGQPPPGGRYGSGCHIHFEMTAGSTPPYSRNYNPIYAKQGSGTNPIDPTPFLAWLNGHGADPNNPVQGDVTLSDPITGAITGAIAPIGGFFTAIGGLTPWLGAPLRIVKLLTGIAFVGFGLVVAVWPEAAGLAAGIAGTAATGSPLIGAQFGNQVREATRRSPFFGPANVGGQLAAKQTIAKTRAQVAAAHVAGTQHGTTLGIKQQQAAQHAKASAAAKKAAATRKANKAAAQKQGATMKSTDEDREEVAYIGGKRVGVMRGGKLVPDVKPKTTEPNEPLKGVNVRQYFQQEGPGTKAFESLKKKRERGEV